MRRFAFLLLVPLLVLAQRRIDALAPPFRGQEQVLYVWSGERLKRFAPGFHDLLADVYWLRTVQYFGAQRMFSPEKRFDLLLPLITITTELDPRLEVAYRYGAIFLCEQWPVGKGAPHEGIAVLERGVRALPRSWRLRQDLGYFRYVFLGDVQGGARELLAAARLPGAPYYLEPLAGSILSRGGDRATARAVWQRLYEQSEGGFFHANALINLQRLDGLDALDALSAALVAFRERHGRAPAQLGELARAGLVAPALLFDRAGVPFAYDAASGWLWFDRSSRLWRPRGQ